MQTHFGQFASRGDVDSLSVEALLDSAQAAGVTMIRDECYWSDVETSPGVFAYPKAIDNYIAAATRHGIRVLLILDYNNPLYAPHAGSAVATTPNRAAFARYCSTTVARYSPRGVKHYEIWNEPNNPMFWDPAPSAAEYALLLQAAYPAIKRADSTVTVIACATSPLEGNPAPAIQWNIFIAGVLGGGGGAYMDALSIHLYRVDRGPERWLGTDMAMAQSLVGTSVPIWITECGYPTHSGWPNLTPEAQANFIVRLYLLGNAFGQIRNITYYDFKNDGTDPANAEHNFGMLLFDRTPKPAFRALKTMRAMLEGKPFRGIGWAGENYVATFGPDSARTHAVWCVTGTSVQGVTLRGQNAILYDREGNRIAVYLGDTLQTVGISTYPRYLAETPVPPSLSSFSVLPQRLALDTAQSAQLTFSGASTDLLPASIGVGAVTFVITGPGGVVDGRGFFTPAGYGEGLIIASCQGLKDTVVFSSVEPVGEALLEDFEVPGVWTLNTANMNGGACGFAIDGSASTRGSASGRLDLNFTIRSTTPRLGVRAHLRSTVMVPGRPDTMKLDVYGNGQPNVVGFYFHEPGGRLRARFLTAQPATWSAQWGTVRLEMGLLGATQFPLTLDSIMLQAAATPWTVDSTYVETIWYDNLRVVYPPATSVDKVERVPGEIDLRQNYPNPFNPETVIEFSIVWREFVLLKVYDILGREVETLAQGDMMPGVYRIVFDGRKFSTGVYFCRLTAGSHTRVRKMVLAR